MRNLSSKICMLIMTISLTLFAFGCAGVPSKPMTANQFDADVNGLIDGLLAKQAFRPMEIAPSAVVPGALKSECRFSRLEELIVERLRLRLREEHALYDLTRGNCFQIREGKPLTFPEQPQAKKTLLQNLIIYEVNISPEENLEQVRISIVATDVKGNVIPGIISQVKLGFAPGDLARRLYFSDPENSPYPEGLEERPYTSIDRLVFSLATQLADAYRNASREQEPVPAKEEVQVLLRSVCPSGDVSLKLVQAIQRSLQQAIVENPGFTCVISREDLAPAFQQVEFYRRHDGVFEMEQSLFRAGTVLLLADIFKHRDGESTGVNLRALWLISPLESETGELIPTNKAGTYLKGFTAKAYFSGKIRTSGAGQRGETLNREPRRVSSKSPSVKGSYPFHDLGVCFYEFSEVLEKRIYPILSQAPGVTDISRAESLCDDLTGCLCYTLHYHGSVETLSSWLRSKLRTSQVVPFRLVPRQGGRLDVYFDGGFK